MPDQAPLVCVVILNWNLKVDTASCVASVLASDYSRLRVVVVDNGSTDGSAAYLRERFPNLDIVSAGQNLGYAAGNNIGIRRALEEDADLVMLLNNDAIVAPTTLSAVAQAAREHPTVGIFSPLVYYDDPPNRLWHCGARDRHFLPLPRNLGPADIPPGATFLAVDYVVGCAMAIRRAVVDAIGGLEESYWMYHEDVEFCRRARAAGWGIGVVPTAAVWHKIGASTQRDRPSQRYWRTRSRVRFYLARTHGWPGLLLLPLLAGSIGRLALGDLAHCDFAQLGASLRGTYDGLRDLWNTPPKRAL